MFYVFMCLCFVFCVLTLFLQGVKPPHTFSAVGQGAYGGQSPLCRRPGGPGGLRPPQN
jgi:hypothetical protein